MDEHKILFVDDEQGILESLTRLFLDEDYSIETAIDGKKALKKMENNNFSLIISDQRMPEMTGAEFLEKAKELSPDTIRIMLTGHSDIKDAIAAINEGEIYKYINKPWDDDELKLIIKQALKQYELILENRTLNMMLKKRNEELKNANEDLEQKVQERTQQIKEKNKELENNFITSIRVFTNLILHYDSFLGNHCKRVSILSSKLAESMRLPETQVLDIEIASLLHDIGAISLDRKMFFRDKNELNKTELAQLEQHPVLGQESISVIKKLDKVGIVIRHHHERYDGRGYPDGLKRDEIPIEARIIAVTDSYDLKANARSYTQEASPQLAENYLKENSGSYLDPDIVNLFFDFLEHATVINSNEVTVPLSNLTKGMRLSRDLLTKSRRLLIERESTLREIDLERIFNFHKMDPIVDKIYVYK